MSRGGEEEKKEGGREGGRERGRREREGERERERERGSIKDWRKEDKAVGGWLSGIGGLDYWTGILIGTTPDPPNYTFAAKSYAVTPTGIVKHNRVNDGICH